MKFRRCYYATVIERLLNTAHNFPPYHSETRWVPTRRVLLYFGNRNTLFRLRAKAVVPNRRATVHTATTAVIPSHSGTT